MIVIVKEITKIKTIGLNDVGLHVGPDAHLSETNPEITFSAKGDLPYVLFSVDLTWEYRIPIAIITENRPQTMYPGSIYEGWRNYNDIQLDIRLEEAFYAVYDPTHLVHPDRQFRPGKRLPGGN